MESFVIRPTTWPVLRLFSRNPLTRTCDRLEGAVVALAVIFVVIAAACAGIVGTVVHDTETQKFLEQGQTRHTLVATAVADSKPEVSAGTTASTVHAQWRVNGINHTGVIGWAHAVKAGEPLPIWVDADGNRVDRPTPIGRATADALSAAVVGWLIVALAATQVVAAVRAHANRMRDAEWEKDIHALVDEGGGRTNHSQ
jgi:hypothetical protein